MLLILLYNADMISKKKNLFDGVDEIVPLFMYYPSLDTLSESQKSCYFNIKKKLDSGIYVDIGDNITYIFLYVYKVLENVKNLSKIPLAIEKLSQITKLYKCNDKIYGAVKLWIGDLYCLSENFPKALEIYSVYISMGHLSSHLANNILNLKFFLRKDVTAKELLSLNRKFTKFVKDKWDNVECYCELVLAKEKELRNMDYIQYITEKYSDKYRYDMTLFAGVPCGYDLRLVNKNLPKIMLYYAIPEVIKFCDQLSFDAENLLRESMQVPKIGEGWISETELFYKIKSYAPELNPVHHYKAPWLGRQHLDIFIPSLRVAFEYQGIQHFKPVDFFGGEKAYQENLRRDKEKRKKCRNNKVILYEVLPGYNFDDIKSFIKDLKNKKI